MTIAPKSLTTKPGSGAKLTVAPAEASREKTTGSSLINFGDVPLIAVRGVQVLSGKRTDLNGNGRVGRADYADQYILLQNLQPTEVEIPAGSSLEIGSGRSIPVLHPIVLSPGQELRVLTRPEGPAGDATEAAVKARFPDSAFYFVRETKRHGKAPGLSLHEAHKGDIALKIGGVDVSAFRYVNQRRTGLLCQPSDPRPAAVALYRKDLPLVTVPTEARLGVAIRPANPNLPLGAFGLAKPSVTFAPADGGGAVDVPAKVVDDALVFEQPVGAGTLDIELLVLDRLNSRSQPFKASVDISGASSSLPIAPPSKDKVTMSFGRAELKLHWDGADVPSQLEVDAKLNFISTETGLRRAEPINEAFVWNDGPEITVSFSTGGEPGFISGRLTLVDPRTDRAKVIRIDRLAVDVEENRGPRIEVDRSQLVGVGQQFSGDISATLYDPNPGEVRDLKLAAGWELHPASMGPPKLFEAKVTSDVGELAEIGRPITIAPPPAVDEPGELVLRIAAIDPNSGVGSVDKRFLVCGPDEVAKILFDTRYLLGSEATDLALPVDLASPITTASVHPSLDDQGRPRFKVVWVKPDGGETDLTSISSLDRLMMPWGPRTMSPLASRASDSMLLPPGRRPGGWFLRTKIPEGAGRLELRDVELVASEYTSEGLKEQAYKDKPARPLVVRQVENQPPELLVPVRDRFSVVKGAEPLPIPLSVKDESGELKLNFAAVWTNEDGSMSESSVLPRRQDQVFFLPNRVGLHQVVGEVIDPFGASVRVKTEIRVLEHDAKPPVAKLLNPSQKADLSRLGGDLKNLPPVSAELTLGDTALERLQVLLLGTTSTVDDNGQKVEQPFAAKANVTPGADGTLRLSFPMEYVPQSRDFTVNYRLRIEDLETFKTVEAPGTYAVTVGAQPPVVDPLAVRQAQRGGKVSWPVLAFDPNLGPVELSARLLKGSSVIGSGTVTNDGSHHQLTFTAPSAVGEYSVELSCKDSDGVTKVKLPLEVVDFGGQLAAPAWSEDNQTTSKRAVVLRALPSLEAGAAALSNKVMSVSGREPFAPAGPFDFPRTVAPGWSDEPIALPITDSFAQYNAALATQALVDSLDGLKYLTPVSEILSRRGAQDGKLQLRVNDLYEANAYAASAAFSTRYGYTETLVTAADKDTVWHELGHCFGEALAPGLSGGGEGSFRSAIHEGLFGDILGCLLAGDPNAADDWNNGWPLRRVANRLTTEDTSEEGHDRGRVYSGLFWDVATGASAYLQGQSWQKPADEAAWKEAPVMETLPETARDALLKLWVLTCASLGSKDLRPADVPRALAGALHELGPSLGLSSAQIKTLASYAADLGDYRRLGKDAPAGKPTLVEISGAEVPFAEAIAKALPVDIASKVQLEELKEYALELGGKPLKRFAVKKPLSIGGETSFVRVYDEYVTVREREPGKLEVQLGNVLDWLKDLNPTPASPAVGVRRAAALATELPPAYPTPMLAGAYERLVDGALQDAESLGQHHPKAQDLGGGGPRRVSLQAHRARSSDCLRVASKMAGEELRASQFALVGRASAATQAGDPASLLVIDQGALKMIIETSAMTYLAPVVVKDGVPEPDLGRLERRVKLDSAR